MASNQKTIFVYDDFSSENSLLMGIEAIGNGLGASAGEGFCEDSLYNLSLIGIVKRFVSVVREAHTLIAGFEYSS